MNEQLQQALAAIINKTMQGVDAGTAFLQAEIPDVIRQLLVWKLADALISAAFCAAVLVAYWLFIRAFRKAKGSESWLWDSCFKEPSLQGVLVGAVGGVASVAAVICLMRSVSTAVQIALAPKLYLIEYVANLAK